ncbi:MAG TPA: DJ-1/PfpI family protein [Candidatus Binatia bacterium]|nr:DJ-1/PfpI family protein [Candidatus Binatia bacterium]
MQIAILLFDGVDPQDAVGPYEVLRWLPGAEVVFVAATPGPQRTERGSLALVADRSLADVPRPDVVVVPGGLGELRLRKDPAILAWLRRVHETTTWTASVCNGACLLGAAGILRGKRAVTHWTLMDELPQFGATAVRERFVFDGKVVTAAGVSAGIDMALALAARIASPEIAQAIQLGIEYDPQPPFDAGSPAKAPAPIVEMVRASLAAATAEVA